jgi:glyoxylase-like metal-dependent hydrolase (beta-lactamase superfamily II)
MTSKAEISLPPSSPNQPIVQISALEGGQLTLPERLFVTDADPEKRATVPSLSFLIRHPTPQPNSPRSTTNIVFDLGISRDLSSYMPAMQSHISNRQPIITHPDVADTLRAGGLDPASDIDFVMLSHVHWDHIGTPSDFPNSKFAVGSGTLHLLSHGAGSHYPAEIFDPDLMPKDRTYELPPTENSSITAASQQTSHKWSPLPLSTSNTSSPFPHTIDFFNDGSLYIIDAPGHLYGHINLLARVGPEKWVYLGGDCCHDVRILKGEKGIALYDDGHGGMRSVHVDTDIASETIERVGKLMGREDVEVVVAHDGGWREKNRGRFFPGLL